MTRPAPALATRAPVIAALDMGYGHLRAAAALASACGGSVVHADRPPVASDDERRAWARARVLYEGLTRAAGAWYAPGARRLLEFVTRIPDAADARDFSRPDFATRHLDRLVREGLGAGLVERLRADEAPLVSTFYASAIAADAAGVADVHLVVTDSDVHRVWAPHAPRGTRITYHVPADATAARLVSYGVPRERIHVTGFPLPPALVGGADRGVLKRNLAARLARLDPRRTFLGPRRDEIAAELGVAIDGPASPPTVVVAVGGAGAQVGLARRFVAGLATPLRQGSLRVVLVAGTRPRVADAFRRWARELDVGAAAEVLFETDFDAYLARLDETLAVADVLWTKPSEMTFYGALGLPLLLAPPLGVHEGRNRAWAMSVGVGIDAGDRTRLPSRLADGTLAAAAWAGFRGMPQLGTSRILDIVAGR